MIFFPHNGYAPGNYMSVCAQCRSPSMACDKRAVSCIRCAFNGVTPVYVFGSNLAGRHGSGAAAVARHQYGAVDGVGAGRAGNSYAIPTKDGSLRPMALVAIAEEVKTFLTYALQRPNTPFQVTAIGCGRAGFTPDVIAPMFAGAPDNCILPSEFKGLVA